MKLKSDYFFSILIITVLEIMACMRPSIAEGALTSCVGSLSAQVEKQKSRVTKNVISTQLDRERIHELEDLIARVKDYRDRNEAFKDITILARTQALKANLDRAEKNQSMIVKRDSGATNVKQLVAQGYSVGEALVKLGVSADAISNFDLNGDMILETRYQLQTENGDRVLNRIQMGFDIRELESSTLILNDLILALKENKEIHLSIVINSSKINYLELLLKTVSKSISKRISVIPTEGDVYLWARDGAKFLADGTQVQGPNNEAILVQNEGVDVKRSEYSKFAELLANETKTPIVKSTFRFEGGDIIVGASEVFIGPKIVQAAMHDFGLSWVQAVYNLSLEYGKKVVPVFTIDENNEPIPKKFHIDLTMTILRSKLTQDEVIFVESPFELLKTLLGKEFTLDSTDREYLEGLESAIERRIDEAKNGKSISQSEIDLFSLLTEERFEVQINHELDSRFMAQLLRSNGYVVKFIPGIMFKLSDSKEYFNWTNVVALSPDNIIVPNYGITKIDKSVASTFRSHGFKVIPAHSTSSTIKNDGGIRCATNCN